MSTQISSKQHQIINDNVCEKKIVTDENMIYFNNILNKFGLDTYVYNKSLIQVMNKIDIDVYTLTCMSKTPCNIDDIRNFICNHCKDIILNDRIERHHLVFNMRNKNNDSIYEYIEIYINLFSKNIKHDIYFTITNLKLNINTGIISLINNFDEFKKEYISKLTKNINNDIFYKICINDLLNNNLQFLLSDQLYRYVKYKFSNKFEFKKRIDYYINNVFKFLPKKQTNKLLNIIDNDFTKKNKMSLKYLIIKPENVNVDDCCSICLEKLQSEECLKLPCCGKFIHKKCLLECENYSNKCPNCRKNLYE